MEWSSGGCHRHVAPSCVAAAESGAKAAAFCIVAAQHSRMLKHDELPVKHQTVLQNHRVSGCKAVKAVTAVDRQVLTCECNWTGRQRATSVNKEWGRAA